MYPKAKKKSPPHGKRWMSRRAEYIIEGEVNRFRYVVESGWKVENGPGQGAHGQRRIFAVVGKKTGAVALFEELASWGVAEVST